MKIGHTRPTEAKSLGADTECELDGAQVATQADAQAGCLRTRIPVLNGDIWENGIQLLIENRGVDVEIDTVLVYHRSYRNGIRDTEGEPGPLLEALLKLNSGS